MGTICGEEWASSLDKIRAGRRKVLDFVTQKALFFLWS
jgi:hypothetical protein